MFNDAWNWAERHLSRKCNVMWLTRHVAYPEFIPNQHVECQIKRVLLDASFRGTNNADVLITLVPPALFRTLEMTLSLCLPGHMLMEIL